MGGGLGCELYFFTVLNRRYLEEMLPPAAAGVTKCHPRGSSPGNVHALFVCDSFDQLKEFCGCVELRHASNSGDKREFSRAKQRSRAGYLRALYIHGYVIELRLTSRM